MPPMGERSLKALFLEHRRPSSEVSPHIDNLEHQVDIDRIQILAVEPRDGSNEVLERRSTSGWKSLS